MERYKKFVTILFLFTIILWFAGFFVFMQKQIPDKIHLNKGEAHYFDWNIPASATISEISGKGNKIPFHLSQPFRIKGETEGLYEIKCRLFGLIPIKEVSLQVLEKQQVYVGGNPIGLYLETDGVLIIAVSKVVGMDGILYEPAQNIMQAGDYIEEINERKITNKDELIQEIKECNGEKLHINIRRNNNRMKLAVTPQKDNTGEYKLGIWVRDNTQGIGTMTYYRADGTFAALGHGVHDIDTGDLMEIKNGSVYIPDILKVVKGEKGNPGEFSGMITYAKKKYMGEIYNNTEQGIFGKLKIKPDTGIIMDVGYKQEVYAGKAAILCNIDEQIRECEVRIEDRFINAADINKGMILKVMDKELLERTGGIIQGMSGSPIIQDGKIIGAVTHVFVNDPTRGYGIFIEEMLTE